MIRKRIVITGVGVVSPIGVGKEVYWKALEAGKSGIRIIKTFDIENYTNKAAGKITDFKAVDYFSAKALVNLDRAAKLVLTAAKLALEDASFKITEENTHDVGVSIGSTFAALNCSSKFDQEALTDGPRLANPSLFPNTVMNAAASRISIRFNIKGLNSTISTGMCGSLDAIDYGVKAIRLHDQKMIVAGGVEDFSEQLFLGFYKSGHLAGLKRGSQNLSCPFDARRNGFVLSEGAGVVILEDLESAQRRKANIYGEVLSIASTHDPHHAGKSNEGMVAAMMCALKRVDLNPEDVDYICANANSSAKGDAQEIQAIKKVFGQNSFRIPVSSIKSMIGETYSSAGALSVIAVVGAMRNNFLPPTINYAMKDPQLDLDYVVNKSRKAKIKTALINTFCNSGLNTTLILKRYCE